jgi:Trk K+ transport system NAD-binding subunit
VTLLDLAGDHTVVEMEVQRGDWVAGHMLAELKLRDEGVFVLGIRHDDGSYIGVPRGSHRVVPGDTLVLYGYAERLEELDDRGARTGDARHAAASRRSTSRSGHASRAAAG